MLGILDLNSNFYGWPSQTIYKKYWEVESCTGILNLSSSKTIRSLPSSKITHIVSQKDTIYIYISNKKWNKELLNVLNVVPKI